jgi:hypothetical protein
MPFKKIMMSLGLVAFLQSTTGCGLLLHPERQGQRGGNLDPAIVLLDGLGLFFFLVPGIVAFAVDFSTGCIYTGGGGRRHLTQDAPLSPADLKEMKAIPIEGPMTKAAIEAALQRELGQAVNITSQSVRVTQLDGAYPALALAQ